MTEPEDPPRLFESADAPSGLRDALQKARADLGSDAEVARLGQRLGPLLAPPAPATPTGALTAKLGLGALALIVAGGGAWILAAQNTTALSPATAPIAPAATLAPTPPLPAPSPPIEPSAPAAASSSGDASPVIKRPAAPPPSEAELLEQARAALKAGDSARALQRASEHARRYPRGVLVQEREVLAIQSLRSLGRDSEAERRAEAFAKSYPGSAFQRKLQR